MENHPCMQTHYHTDPFRNQNSMDEPIILIPLSDIIVNNGGSEEMISDDEYLKNPPAGYRFLPTDDELIVHYLKKKVNNEPLPPNKIHTVNLYEFSPEDLVDMYGGSEENACYFFSPRKRTNNGGTRAHRTTPDGYWKATCGDKPIVHNDEEVGCHKTLEYYQGISQNVKKTDWIMHEYRLKDPQVPINAAENSKSVLDDLVLCRIHNHKRGYATS